MEHDRRTFVAGIASLPLCAIPFKAADAQQIERPSLKLGVANKAHLYYLPLTLAVMDGLVVQVAKQTYVLPIPNIVECLRPGEAEIHRVIGAAGALNLRGDIVPLIYLADVLGVDQTTQERTIFTITIPKTAAPAYNSEPGKEVARAQAPLQGRG